MNLLEFAPEIIVLIVSFLDHDKQLQLNRVSKYFNIDLSKEQFVNVLLGHPFSRLAHQIDNPLWTQKYGMFPLPLGDIKESPNTESILKAFKNSDFPTIRTMLILYGPNNIKITVKKDEFPFIGEIEKAFGFVLAEEITFTLPFLFAHKFGCSMEVCKQIYELIYTMNKSINYGLCFNYFRSLKNGDFTITIDGIVYKIIYGDKEDYFKCVHKKFVFCSMNYSNNHRIGQLVY